MTTSFDIIPERPFDDGAEKGQALGRAQIVAEIERLLGETVFADSFAVMDRAELARLVTARLETPPDYDRFPELADLYPERVDYLRGMAQGAGCTLAEAAVYSYLTYKHWILTFWQMFQVPALPVGGHCSGAALIGPEGILGGQNIESDPLVPKPADYRHRQPSSHAPWRAHPTQVFTGTLRKPRTGYAEQWGVGNERGLSHLCGGSVGLWLEDPIEDTWPCEYVPLARFAANVEELVTLYRRYTLHNPGKGSQIWADVTGNMVVVEKSFREVGFRFIGEAPAIWCTEGYYHTPEMSALLNERRQRYLALTGLHEGAADVQYFTDCVVRFTRLAELCHEAWGHGYAHMNRILTDHAPFPRGICRHGGPDTAPYDITVTLQSWMYDLTHNRSFTRSWTPWEQFPCEAPWTVTQYPEWKADR